MSLYDELKNAEKNGNDLINIIESTTISKRLLFSCVFELTPVCNFRCPFCYARMTKEELESKGDHILGFDEWKRIIDELCEAGTLNLTLTGGECTLHPDFCRIYEYAYDKGMSITIMSNGSNISGRILEMFKRKPPFRFYITVYGGSAKTYEVTCGNAEFYETVRNNLIELKRLKMQVVVQFTAGNDNVMDMEDVYKFSVEIDAPFRATRLLSQFGRCTMEIIEETVADRDEYVIQTEKINMLRYGKISSDINKEKNISINLPDNGPVIEKGIPCNAGRNSCYINYKGEMLPCVSLEALALQTEGRKISDCWDELVRWADNVPRLTECAKCIHIFRCKQCIALHYNDTKEFGKPSPRLCWKQLHPKEAAEIEERFRKNGYLVLGVDC